MNSTDTSHNADNKAINPVVPGFFRTVILLVALIVFFGFLGLQAELVLPTQAPNLSSTYTPLNQSAPRLKLVWWER